MTRDRFAGAAAAAAGASLLGSSKQREFMQQVAHCTNSSEGGAAPFPHWA
jgi:hypothetical protein